MEQRQLRDRGREPLVKIAVAENPATAEHIAQVLAQAGVRCLVKNTDALGVLYGSAWTGAFALQIFVLAGDEQRALATLAGAGMDVTRIERLKPPRRRKRRRHRDAPDPKNPRA